ncbi:VCBS repeat-containing protein [Arenibacter sp. F20364]|uniref:VCBS repeat-containing protein n=1 Tax=Arenibacter sp. F20364 TaxID=2926415 RepID=UPI001FF1A908|nr:VCBS repeat-containing protein [Arenibacter sp. F20364]MCK0188734.1 VCBS repeat-containing protein [Arenibacter sp. F20364]
MMQRFIYFIFLILLMVSCEPKSSQLFSKLDATATGVDFKNKLTETHKYNYFTYPYMYLGGGVSVGDVNNDGLEDIFFTGNMVANKLYLNKGDLKFEDISESAGITGDERWYSGTTFVDINKDGYLDIYCSVGGKNGPNNNVLYINNQDNTFTEKAAEYGIDCDGISMQSTFFDYDNDGDLDLYVINYPPTSFIAPVEYYEYMLDNHELKDSDRLYRNDNGHFTDVTLEAGLSTFGLSLGVVASDVNNDGYMDIYVSNDFSAPDFLFINNQDGTFTNQINSSLQQTSFYGMGADIADFNNDGFMDIFQLDMSAEDNFRSKANMSSMNPEAFYRSVAVGFNHQYMQNSLQMNNGNEAGELPLFSNVARLAGVSSTDWSWGGLMADFDNDGWKDLFITNGIRRDVNNKDFYAKHREFFNKMEKDPEYKDKEEEVGLLEYLEQLPSEKLSNYMFQNNRDLTFTKKTDEWGFEEKTFSNGVAYSDLDNDGDLDLIINNLEDSASIYRNNSMGNNQLSISLNGGEKVLPNGSRVSIFTDDGMQVQEYSTVRGYLSSVTPLMHFGLGKVKEVDSIVVHWPNGTITKLNQIKANQRLNINYEVNKVVNSHPDNKKEIKQFETLETPTIFKHTENKFDDFEAEVLLPHKNSTLGPALATGDLNGDGLDDYVVGGAVGQRAAVYTQTTEGEFVKIEVDDLDDDQYYEDLGILIFDADNDGDNDFYMASGGNEYLPQSPGYEDRLFENMGTNKFKRNTEALPDFKISGMNVTASDFDKDGDLDLFVGGRLVPKKYPFPADSYILENVSTAKGIKFIDATDKVFPGLKSLGLVTSSTWVDFDNDGWEDLVIVGEWMPIKFYRNVKGVFEDVSDQLVQGNTSGWWFSVEKGDFDNDGDQDLVVGNLGKNYKYQASSKSPFKVYLNDFDSNETSDIVLSYKKGETEFPVRGRQCSSQQMPAIKVKFQDYNSFASATLKQIYTPKMLEESLSYEINSFASIYLENNNGVFTARPLPQLAQISSINKFVVDDFNKDGNLDVVLAGNLYNAEVETPRGDASFGLYLQGDGSGNFMAKTMMESGLKIVGDVRGMELLTVKGQKHILVAKNDDFMQMIKVN